MSPRALRSFQVTDLAEDSITVHAEFSHHSGGYRVTLDGTVLGDRALWYLSPEKARELADILRAAACDAELGTDR